MVTVQRLLSIDLGALHAVAEDWRWISWRLEQIGQENEKDVTSPIRSETQWSGDDARSAATRLENIRKDIQAVAKEAKAVGTLLDDVATGTGDGFGALAKHQERARQLVDQAAARNMRVKSDGTVFWEVMRAPGPVSPAEQEHLDQMEAYARTIGDELKKILKTVNEIDETLVYSLRTIFGTRETFRTEDRSRRIDDRGLDTSWTETQLTAVILALRLKGWGDAANLLKHYIDNSGEPYTVDADRMLKDLPQFQKDVNETLKSVRELPDGKFTTDWGSTAPNLEDGGSGNLNWYYALNHFQYRLVGEKHDGEITYHVEVQKRYDWGIPSEHRRPLEKGPIDFEQADLARLNLVGEAKDFDVRGQTSQRTTR
jgi:hypothetical protein